MAWDEKLTLEFNGMQPSISSIEIEKVTVRQPFYSVIPPFAIQPGEPTQAGDR
jgi:hypothetical protein